MTLLVALAAFSLTTFDEVARTFERDGPLAGIIHFAVVLAFLEGFIRMATHDRQT